MKEGSFLSKIGISWKQIGYLLAANIGYALALNLFYVGNNIAAGGLAGIGTVVNCFFNFPVGLTVFILNLPIVLWGMTIKGKRYVFTTVFVVAVYSTIVDAFAFLPCLSEDKIVAVVCGGILYGVSSYFSIRAGISTGGTDLLAKLLITKFKTITVGQMMMMIDGSIVVLAICVYRNIGAGIYAILAIAVAAIVTDKLNSGFNKACVFYIFANKNLDKISNAILADMERGATLLDGEGLYSHEDKKILFVVIKPSEVPRLKAVVHRYDRTAFVIQSSATEIIGLGFESTNLTSTIHDDNDVED